MEFRSILRGAFTIPSLTKQRIRRTYQAHLLRSSHRASRSRVSIQRSHERVNDDYSQHCLDRIEAIVLGSDEEASAAAERLARTRTFAFGPIGIAGRMPEGELALNRIIVRPEPIRFLRPAFEVGTAEARCYVLVGIHIRYPEQFTEFEALFLRDAPREITIMHGCCVDSEPTDVILGWIKASAFGGPARGRNGADANEFTKIRE